MNAAQRRIALRASIKAFPDGCRVRVKGSQVVGTVKRCQGTWALTECDLALDRGVCMRYMPYKHLVRLS